jgi:YggT family protein
MFRIGTILVLILQIFLFALLGRLILDYVRIFARNWRPSGISLYFVEAV